MSEAGIPCSSCVRRPRAPERSAPPARLLLVQRRRVVALLVVLPHAGAVAQPRLAAAVVKVRGEVGVVEPAETGRKDRQAAAG